MKVLALSDKLISFIYSSQVRRRFENIDLVIGCGDLPYYYLEYVLTTLEAPLFFVRGNHDKVVEYSTAGQRTHPHGGVDLHNKCITYNGLTWAGFEGSLRYRPGPFQHSQTQMWGYVLGLVPIMMVNRLKFGRYLDVLITHAPAQGIHDKDDLPHQGINAFRWLLSVFRPSYHFHGHIHIYRPDEERETLFGATHVLNAYPFLEMDLIVPTNNPPAQD